MSDGAERDGRDDVRSGARQALVAEPLQEQNALASVEPVTPTVPLVVAAFTVLAGGVFAAGAVLPMDAADVTSADRAAKTPAAEAGSPVAPTPVTPSSSAVRAPAPTPPAAARLERSTVRTGWGPYARVGPVTLHFPGDVVEAVGLHQSGHDGAQPQQPVESAVRTGLLDTRARDTNPQGAADIVVDPRREVRAPVTGTVLRAGSYTLYCDHVDNYLVVEPDERPGWEVKLLHFEGLAVGKGEHVQAGVTVVGSRARLLPFASQVDKHTVAPHWPHLHVEVVDPSVPDRPTGEGCD